MTEFKHQQATTHRQHEQTKKQAGLACPACGSENEEAAKYCSECGNPLQPAGQCPKCGATLRPGADICEVCGEWLLTGQCKFCYAPLEEGAQFCGECGNPVDGVICPQCGRLSIFDFCKHCEIPLTPQAHHMLQSLQESEDFQSLLRELSTSPVAPPGPEDEERQFVEQWRQFKEQFSQARETTHPFELKHVKQILDRTSQELHAPQETTPPVSALEKLQQRHFSTNQEARRFFGALKVLLPTIVKTKTRTPVGWRCVAFGAFHHDGPQGCADPSKGGQWIFEEHESEELQITETQI